VRVTVLASGSAGNAVLVEAGGEGPGRATPLVIDCGLAARELAKRLDRSTTRITLEDVRAVLCTHEHGDHAGGVPALASAGVATYATGGTARALNLAGTIAVAAGGRVTVDAAQVEAIAMPHDAVEPVGFIIEDEDARVGVITDCGRADPEVAAAFASCDVLVLEANYDPDLLRAGPYPPGLKRRIASAHGHLSNAEAADLLRLMRSPRAQVIVLAHLSIENNKPRLARAAVERAARDLGIAVRLVIATQERPAPPVVIRKRLASILPGMDDRQLRLAFPDHP
jgi:phosphoribosyl 1,2-cyclic phosphodiesterase